jgi:hypothetical protein
MEHQFVSLNKDKQILGVIGYHINRSNDYADNLWIMNFSDNVIVFGIDVRRAIDNLFMKYNFRKITFTVVIGNPVEKSYDRLVSKYGGRIVGTYKENVRLMDNKFYDEKLYEIFRDEYIEKCKK